MPKFLARRLLLAIPMLLVTTSVTFLIMTLSAGSYVPGLDLESSLSPDDIQRLKVSLGLDRPLHVQYLSWMGGILRLDFGRSMIDSAPVLDHILQRLPNTMQLSFAAMLLALAGAIPIGVISALKRGSALDQALNVFAVAGFALPQFWLGLVMIALFSVAAKSAGLPWLPAGGAYDPGMINDVGDRVRHLILPGITLSLVYLSIWSRFVRSSMVEVLSQDYVRTARAKGLREQAVLYVHALRNALTPLITIVGMELPRLFSGSLVIEVVFGWPGIGRFAYERAVAYDFTAVLGVTTFFAVMVIVGNLLADIGYGLMDPRVRQQA